MEFEKEAKPYEYRTERKGGEDIIYFNYKGVSYSPSLENYPQVMERTVDSLIENPNVSRIVFVQDKNYNYDFIETSYLLEIASLYVYFMKQEKILSHERLVTTNEEFFPRRYNNLFSFLYLLKQDPVAAYYELKRILIEARVFYERIDSSLKIDQGNYVHFLEKIFNLVEKTKLIQASIPYLEGYRKGDRTIYSYIFKPDLIPNFTFTRLVRDIDTQSEIIDEYQISNKEYDVSTVTIFRKKTESKLYYYLSPPESSLSEDENLLLNLARGVLIEHQPKAEEFTDTERTRQVFFNVSKDLLRDLSNTKGIKVDFNQLNKLATILVRHTIGFGLVEVLLQDNRLQDISLNAPISQTPIYARHQDYDECLTNILPSREDSDGWAAKFRMLSGRPLDEANPILDTQLEIGKMRARIAIIQNPLSPDGLAYSIRRHRESPWTLPLFIQNKMINPLGAGLMSFMIDGARTLLVAGTRSSGKTSFLEFDA
jgi:archaeal flagellar protein FlaI